MAQTIIGRSIDNDYGKKSYGEGYIIKVEKYRIDEWRKLEWARYCNNNHPSNFVKQRRKMSESALNETSVRYVDESSFIIKQSSLMTYYPNKHQIDDYIRVAKSVEIDEAKKGNYVEVILYEKYLEETADIWSDDRDVLHPIKFIYNSITNPEVENIFISQGIKFKVKSAQQEWEEAQAALNNENPVAENFKHNSTSALTEDIDAELEFNNHERLAILYVNYLNGNTNIELLKFIGGAEDCVDQACDFLKTYTKDWSKLGMVCAEIVPTNEKTGRTNQIIFEEGSRLFELEPGSEPIEDRLDAEDPDIYDDLLYCISKNTNTKYLSKKPAPTKEPITVYLEKTDVDYDRDDWDGSDWEDIYEVLDDEYDSAVDDLQSVYGVDLDLEFVVDEADPDFGTYDVYLTLIGDCDRLAKVIKDISDSYFANFLLTPLSKAAALLVDTATDDYGELFNAAALYDMAGYNAADSDHRAGVSYEVSFDGGKRIL